MLRVAVVGAGAAGLGAAAELARSGVEVTLLDVEPRLGGILNQCIHPGFGLHRFGEELTGPEFAERLEIGLREVISSVRLLRNTLVYAISPEGDGYRLSFISPELGDTSEYFDAVLLATGARERTPAAALIEYHRVAGIYTAGAAQYLMNIKGWLPGRRVLIVGSGDVGLIMARRMTLEGAEVVAVLEKQPFPGGLPRNVKQCLEDFGIPLLLSHTVSQIEHQNGRVSGAVAVNLETGDEKRFDVDTVLFSIGLIPNVGLLKGITEVYPWGVKLTDGFRLPGRFNLAVAGNAATIFDLADHAAISGELAARAILSPPPERLILVVPTGGLRVFPSFLEYSGEGVARVNIRVPRPMDRVLIEVCDGETGKVLFTREFKEVVPAQMVEVCMPHSLLRGVGEVRLRWRIPGK